METSMLEHGEKIIVFLRITSLVLDGKTLE